MRFFSLSTLSLISASLLFSAPANSTAAIDSLELVDVHRHVHNWVSPTKLETEMRELNIGWSGGVGAPYGPFSTQPYSDLLKQRYIATIGQVTMSDIYKYRGAKGLEDPEVSEHRQMLVEAERLFESGSIKGFGELILNNEHSNPNPSFRRKARIDSEAMVNIFRVADKWGAFVHIHAEDDPESVAQLKAIATNFPAVPIILAHCLFTADTLLIDTMLSEHSNFYCEMSARNESMFSGFFAKKKAAEYGWIVYDDQSLDAKWKELIERHKTRFMIGTDTFNRSVDVRKTIHQIRRGLLANLSPETAVLVASENAIRVMKLEK
ncbi:amidohydrolase family protein [Rheinheimera sp.]|uniref:amidohydrolase family protein n=1 Tax=Rheinheimera sp. TaxID=1869214 RepID=UPI0040476DAA